MAGVKTGKASGNQPGQKSAPKRPKDWVAPARVIKVTVGSPVIAKVTATPTARLATTDEEKKAVAEYDAACKLLAGCRPNDRGAEGKRGVAYQKLVQQGLRPQVRGKYR